MFQGITHHDRTLSTPQQTSTNTKQSTRKDQESRILINIVRKQSSHVKKVTKTTKRKRKTKTNTIGNRTGKETHNGESAIQRCIGIVHVGRVDLTTATKSTDCIVHAGTEEANE